MPAAVFSTKRACPNCGTGFPELDPRLFSFNSRHGWCPGCFGTGLALPQFDGEQSGEEAQWRDADGAPPSTCSECGGERLNTVARHVLFRGLSIAALTNLPVQEFAAALRKFKLSGREFEIARDLFCGADARAPRSSAMWVSATCSSTVPPPRCPAARHSGFVSPRSSARICRECATCSTSRRSACTRATTRRCSARSIDCAGEGNTLIVVEHDEDTIRRADHVIDLGPGAGTRGGQRRGAGHRRATRAPEQFGDRPLPRGAAAPFARAPPHGGARDALDSDHRRDAAQSVQSRCAHPPRPLDGHHGRIGFRQVLAGARGAAQESRAPRGAPRPLRRRART